VFELFALHAEHGPLSSFRDDMALYAQRMAEPQILYALGRAWGRAQQPLMASGFFQMALASGMMSQEDHLAVGTMLLERGWVDLAEGELEAVLALRPRHQPGEFDGTQSNIINAQLRLWQAAGGRKDDRAAAEHLRTALESMEQMGATIAPRGGRAPDDRDLVRELWALTPHLYAVNAKFDLMVNVTRAIAEGLRALAPGL
jgi:hypothetical protein